MTLPPRRSPGGKHLCRLPACAYGNWFPENTARHEAEPHAVCSCGWAGVNPGLHVKRTRTGGEHRMVLVNVRLRGASGRRR